MNLFAIFSWLTRRRVASTLSLLWGAALAAPFLFFGDNWGMVWFYMAWPLAEPLKFLWEDFSPVSYVAIVTFLHVAAVFAILDFLSGQMTALLRGPDPGPAASADPAEKPVTPRGTLGGASPAIVGKPDESPAPEVEVEDIARGEDRNEEEKGPAIAGSA